MAELSDQTGRSKRTLQRQFDRLIITPYFPRATTDEPINLVVDGTFFGRTGGVFVFRADGKNIYWRIIHTETVDEIEQGLTELEQLGYQFKSVTLDGKRGILKHFEQRYPHLPIQFCHFHQAQIIRRYLTLNPKTECGQYLKAIMKNLTTIRPDIFESMLNTWAELYHEFLHEKNKKGRYNHQKLRSAWRSLKTHLP